MTVVSIICGGFAARGGGPRPRENNERASQCGCPFRSFGSLACVRVVDVL